MPKILINEKDRTSPGTPASYANFTVLVAGLAKTDLTDDEVDAGVTLKDYAKKREAAVDSNGVYEFSSAEAFKNTIGLVPPEAIVDYNDSETKIYHYGNQMAYELLTMGYNVIYKVVTKAAIADLGSESFWSDFKDKASYDFRFVTHGLLESTGFATADIKKSYEEKVERLEAVKVAVDVLNGIIKANPIAENATESEREKVTAARGNAYAEIYSKYAGFIESITDGVANHFKNFDDAYAGLVGTTEEPGERTTLETAIKNIVAGGITTALINQANTCIANLAKYSATGAGDTNEMDSNAIPGRGDCVALIEADEKLYVDTTSDVKPEGRIINAINEMSGITSSNGKFCAMTVPSVHYKMTPDVAYNENKKFPGAFHYLACFMNSLKLGFAEWYAAAGYTRGVSSYVIDHASVKLGEIAINALEPRNYDDPQEDYPKFACNVIANFRGSYYLWGNRTAHPLGKKGSVDTGDLVASSFLNIRQLCCTIKKQLYVACRSFTFDPNSDTLWVNFCNAIRPTLDAMKADQGIRDYKIVKVYTDKKATLKAKIRIIPIEAVEDFDLEVSLEDSFGETAAVVTE
jgi:hypothetical protein